jgi:hypothetical protein
MGVELDLSEEKQFEDVEDKSGGKNILTWGGEVAGWMKFYN